MSFLTINKVRIVGMGACVPATVEENIDLPIFIDEEEAKKVIESTGIERHRCVQVGTTASDLAVKAVEKVMADLDWDIKTVDVLIYVCTSRDYITPMTACILQDRLGMRQDSFCMDAPMGCAGWVYGMSMMGALMQNGSLKRGLLINAETNTRNRSMKDKTMKPLFGDAATVTALEYDENWFKPMNFAFGVDGSGAESVMAKYGGCRYPATVESLTEVEIEPGIVRKGTDIVMNGMDVFGFAIRRPGKQVRELIAEFGIDTESVDYLLLHQANLFIDEHIRKSLKFPKEKTPFCLADYGNVSGASIPLTMVTQIREGLENKENHLLGCGFGVGLSWASCELMTKNIKISDMVIYE